MTLLGLTGLLNFITSLSLGLFVLLRKPNSPTSQSYFGLSFAISLYSFGYFMWQLSSDVSRAMFWFKTLFLGIILINQMYLVFVMILSECLKAKKGRLLVSTMINIIFIWLNYKSLLFETLVSRYGLGYWPEPKFLFHLYLIFWHWTCFYGFACLIMKWRNSTGLKRQQIKYVTAAFAIGYLGGATNWPMWYNIYLPPYPNIGISIHVALIGYTIVRYRLMDINLLLKRAGLLGLVYTGLLLITTPLLLHWHSQLSHSLGTSSVMLGLEVFILSAVLSFGPFLYAYLEKQSTCFREDTLAGLTHELKGPLASIESSLDILNDQLKSFRGDSNLHDYLEMIQRNSNRLNHYVNDLLQVFQQQRGQNTLSKEETSLSDLCHQLTRNFHDQANLKNVTIKTALEDEKLTLHCDPIRIEQVLSNLLSNAIKFSNSGEIELSARKSQRTILVSVLDHGEGIPPKELPYVFERFFQASNNHQAKGSGLGLAIARSWIEAHSGQIWAESEGEGRGTKVTFTLPQNG